MRKGISNHFNLGLKIWFAIVSGHILEALHLFLGLRPLNVVWNRQLVHRELVRLLWVLVPVLPFHYVVKARLSLPPGLVVFFFLQGNFIFIDDWEGEAEVLG